MAMANAIAFLDKLEEDEALVAQLSGLKNDPAAMQAAVAAAGFDATPEEFRVAFLSRFGSELSTEQLEAVAGGVDGDWLMSFTIGMGATVGAVVGGIAAAVAIG